MKNLSVVPTIVLVDDDEGHRTLIRRSLVRVGLTNPILEMDNGERALDFVQSFVDSRPPVPPLLVLDINMVGMNGAEVLRRMKSGPRTRSIPVIMLTTTDDPREVRRCYDLGCNVYITKPVEPNDFIEAIRRLGMFISIMQVSPLEEPNG